MAARLFRAVARCAVRDEGRDVKLVFSIGTSFRLCCSMLALIAASAYFLRLHRPQPGERRDPRAGPRAALQAALRAASSAPQPAASAAQLDAEQHSSTIAWHRAGLTTEVVEERLLAMSDAACDAVRQ